MGKVTFESRLEVRREYLRQEEEHLEGGNSLYKGPVVLEENSQDTCVIEVEGWGAGQGSKAGPDQQGLSEQYKDFYYVKWSAFEGFE